MFKEYFLHTSACVRIRAFLGLLLFFAHIAYKNVVRVRVNEWYERFYSFVQQGDESSSGDNEMQDAVWRLLVEFVVIVTPNVVIHPVYRALQGAWTLDWRLALVNAYLRRWRILARTPVVEGAAQRVHEDARLFCTGIGGIVAAVLDATITLVAFAPILHDLGAKIVLPGHRPGELRASWLLLAVAIAALFATVATALLARGLVALEIAVQQVEAALRTLLVYAESSPGWILEQLQDPPPTQSTPTSPRAAELFVLQPFFVTMRQLRATVHGLLSTTLRMNTFLAVFHEATTLSPYFIAAPLLFAEQETRITLGVLVQLSNVTDKVLGALSVFADNTENIIAFVSVVKRLKEFEKSQTGRGALLVNGGAARVATCEATELSAAASYV